MKDTKEKILNTALKMFAENGYYAASVRKITAQIGFRESALYNHFDSKNKILESLCEIYKPGRINSLIITDDLIDELNQPEKFLEIFAKRLVNHWFENEEKLFFMFILKEGKVNYKKETITLTSYLDELRTTWWMIFDEMKKLKIIKDINPKNVTDEYLYFLLGVRIEALQNSISQDELFKKVNGHVNFIWNAIKRES